MEPEVKLIGYKLLPGVPVVVKDKEESDDCIWTMHITQFALGDTPKPGRNVVRITTSDGGSFVIGALTLGTCEQFTADIMIRESVELTTSGHSDVHLVGYLTTTELLTPDGLYDTDDEALDAAENELEGREASDEEGTEDLEENEAEMMEGESSEEDLPAAEAVQQLQEELEAGLKRKARSRAASLKALATEVESSEEEEGSEEDPDTSEAETSSGEEEEEEEAAGPEPPSQRKPNKSKRPPPTELNRAAKKLPKTANGEFQKGAKHSGGKPGANEAWEAAIRQHIAKEGPSSLSQLGSAVKKPAGVSKKLKQLIADSAKFVLSADGQVKLKK